MPLKIAVAAVVAVLVLIPAPPSAGRQPDDGFSPDLFSGLSYRMIGPSRGGRVTAVAGHRAEPSTFYMGATGGGVWKTTDYGHTWRNVSDGFFATPSIGALRVAESDPKIVYVSTGSDGLRSNVIVGKGIYKSTDAGKTWEHVGLERTGNSGAVLIHPENPDLVYVAAIGNPFVPNPERGVYRTRDGGTSWELVLFISEKTGAVDLEFAPDNPEEIYATTWLAERKPWTIISGGMEGGVYKSSDGGDTWSQLTEGLPQGLRGKADLAVSAGDPDRVYVLIEATPDEGGVYRSDDRGATWRRISDFDKIQTRPFYYCNLEAHPKNPDVLWGMTEGFWKSEDAGETWKSVRVPHGDNHDMWINPDNPDLYVQANDGGANVTLDGGKTWSTQHNQPTAELYQVDVSDAFPYRLYAGQQDNTTISVPSLPERSVPGGPTALWESHGGCETGPAVPKPGDPDIVYANCKGRFGVYNRRTGAEQHYYVGFWNLYGRNPKDLAYRFQRVSPIHVSPHDPERVYHASQYVHVTDDGGETWRRISDDLTAFTPETQVVSGAPITRDVTGEEHFSTLYDVQESPHEPGVIWAGANDGPIHLTRDGGETWKDVTPEDVGPYGRVQQIEVSPHRPAKAYAAILRYQLGDFSPHAYMTEDYGETWTRITDGTNGVPADFPVRVVREDPHREGLLYAGTEFGIFVSFDDGGHWQSFQLDLPVTPVTDIKLVGVDLALSTMGRGFYILYDLSALHEIERVSGSEAYLFAVEETYRLRRGRRRGPPSPSTPQYPAPGAKIDYYLAADAVDEIRLEILDAEGHLIRELSSRKEEKKAEASKEEPSNDEAGEKKKEEPKAKPSPGTLVKTAGMHRFTWDLRYEGPQGPDPDEVDEEAPPSEGEGAGSGETKKPKKSEEPQMMGSPERPGPRGPLVPPGIYQARLVVGDWQETRSFEVKMDPRIVAAGITAQEVQGQAELALKTRDALSRARLAAERIRDDERLALIRRRLVTDGVRYSTPMLIDQLDYLYGNLDRSDQAPGQDAYARYEELTAELQGYQTEIEGILGPPTEED